MRVAICGAGAIGAATACYLSRRGAEVIVVERLGMACAASGKAGGFLALDWCAGTPLDALARRSFMLHARLPEEIGGDWGYRRLTTYHGFGPVAERASGRSRAHLDWLIDRVAISGRIGSPETSALVHPAAFTAAMMRAAQERGARFRIGQVTNVVRTDDGSAVSGVAVEGDVIEADAVVIAMGPWSALASAWLPLPRIFAEKGHSIVFETGTDVPAEAVFLEYREPDGAVLTPELFPRADGTTYVSAISRRVQIPESPAEVAPDTGAIERLETMCRNLSPKLETARIVTQQACCRPVTQDGMPLIGRVPGIEGAYVAAGHSVWGILNAPGTGEAMAELILDGSARSIDLRPFDPGRLHRARPL